MEKNELQLVKGGGISGVVLNAALKAINLALELGRSLGSAIRRAKNKSYCR